MKSKDIRELSDSELQKKLRETRDERVLLRMKKNTGQVDQPHNFKKLGREIARLETILKEKKLASAKA